jgi:hypothetical protein
MRITLSSSSGSAAVPGSITVPAGASSTTFTISTSTVSSSTTATITASDGSSSQNATLTLQPAVGTPWWQSTWLYRLPLTVQNTASSSLPVRYSVQATVDTAHWIGLQQMLASCADLRVVYFDGASSTQLDRVVNSCNTSQTEVWFALQRSIPAGSSDNGYYLYYGNADPGTPPSNGMNVFVFYENWENSTSHWTGAGGLDTANTGTLGTSQISTDYAWSPTHGQKFSTKRSGGDAFSGLIPVTPNTMYAASVRGISATAAYMPVGFDPYDAAKTKGDETWFWTTGWTLSTQWTQQKATFTTAGSTAFIRLKSEWWDGGPGTAPVYLDDLVLRLAANSDPNVTIGTGQNMPQ